MLDRGERVDGRFEVEERVGSGGMAEVYRVRHLSLGSVHALKVLSLPHPGLRERFLREGRIQAQIRHPNVVAVTDVIEHRGRLGLLMEYVDHVSLQQLLDLQGALPLEESLQIFARILSGVEAAHASGVLHRDLKPANILLARSAQGLVPKITDFGIAKVVLEGMPAGATRDGSMMGTPGYMAPEQVRNAKDVDRRADVFALGAILYTMLAGRPPFDLDSPDLFEDTLEGRFPPLETLVPGLPPAVVAAVHGAMEPDAAARIPSARAFGEALFADRPELLALVVGSAEDSTPVSVHGALLEPRSTLTPPTYAGGMTPTGSLPPAGETLALDRGRRLPVVALVAGGLAVLLGLAAVLTLRSPSTPEPAAEPAVAPSQEPLAAPAPEAGTTPVTAPIAAPSAEIASTSTGARPATTSAARAGAPEAAALEASATAEAPSAAPTPSEPEAATSEPAPAPAEPASAVEAAVAVEEPAAPELSAPAVKGTWNGTANGRPATLAITSQSGEALKAELRLTQGPSQRVVALSGRIDAQTGALRLEEAGGDRMVLSGRLSGDTLAGTFTREGQGKALSWEVSR